MKPLTLKTKARRLYGQSDAHNDLYNEDKTDTPVDPAHFNVNLLRSGLLSASATVGSHECPSHIRGTRQESMRVLITQQKYRSKTPECIGSSSLIWMYLILKFLKV